MDEAISVLSGFPSGDKYPDNDTYDQAIRGHVKNVVQLLDSKSSKVSGDEAINLLRVLDPAVNSIAYLALLDHLGDYDAFPAEQRAEALIDFFLRFDAGQIRYAGALFTEWLGRISKEAFPIPHDVKVGLIASSILRIDPSGSMLTSHHLTLANLAYDTDNPENAFTVLNKQVVYFPGMAKDQKKEKVAKLLCDMSLPPMDYITVDSGLTTKLSVEQVMEYDLLSGLLYCSRGHWKSAHAAFERVITHPTRDGGVSTIMTDAYNKWLLVSLLVGGRTPEIPANAGSNAKKSFETLGKPYAAIASHFDAMAAVPLKEEVEKNVQRWRNDRNTGLVRQVLAAHQKWQIMDLRKVYSKVSLSDIRNNTCSAETGAALPSDDEIERLIQGMIETGMLKGTIEKPDGKPPYLRYLPESEELSEADYKREIASATLKLKELETIYKTTNARLSTNQYWIKHVLREQKREKDNSGQAAPMSFDAHIEDEDLMSGVMSGSV